MKKILMFTKSMDLGGTENVILQLIQNLKNEFEFTVLSNGGLNIQKLNDLGVKHIEIGDITTKNPFKILKHIFKIKSIIKNNNFDIIHTHHRMAAFYVSLLKIPCKKIHTMHNTFYDKKKLTKFSLNRFITVACGKTVRDNLIDYFDINPSDIILIENGIDNFYKQEKLIELSNFDESIIKFCFVGRLCKQKGIDILLNSWLLKKSKNCCLFIYGDGELKDSVIDFISKVDDAHFGGYTNNPLNVISQFDYLILPSRWEGLPLTLLESMAVNTTILCSNIDSNKEIIIDRITGYLFENENAIELANLIDFACSKKIVNTSEQAKVVYNKKYSIDKFKEKYKKIYSTE